jgi:hypothetical protein
MYKARCIFHEHTFAIILTIIHASICVNDGHISLIFLDLNRQYSNLSIRTTIFIL